MDRSSEAAWRIEPLNGYVEAALIVLFIYLFFRHAVFILMLLDVLIGWLRRFRWFPVAGRRLRATVHWLIAVTLFLGFLGISGWAGWVEFIPISRTG